MLKRVDGREDTSGARVLLKDASFPEPFYDGLEYSPPARGTWNIVHTTMLVPDSHQIYICALGCLRGVVLTAAEMNAMDRFSSIVIEEHHLYDGSMEDTIVNGVGEILAGLLPKTPRVIFLYPACIHHFMGADMDGIVKRLQETYTQTRFVLCWMDPIRRHSNLPPEIRTRCQIYSLWKKQPADQNSVNLIGSNLAVENDSALMKLLRDNGMTVRQLPTCQTYAEYEAMGSAGLNLAFEPLARPVLPFLQERYGQPGIYLSDSFDYQEITAALYRVADAIGAGHPDCRDEINRCETAFRLAKEAIGDMPVAIDYAATFRPFSLVRALLGHGFQVRRIYVDVCNGDDSNDFQSLQQSHPALELYPTRHAKMRCMDRHSDEFLAIGQKAAYFTGTRHFVDLAEGGGWYDFAGIRRMLAGMVDACEKEKDPRDYVRIKGWGCHICR